MTWTYLSNDYFNLSPIVFLMAPEKKQLYIVCGRVAAGKTTFIHKLQKKFPSYVTILGDDVGNKFDRYIKDQEQNEGIHVDYNIIRKELTQAHSEGIQEFANVLFKWSDEELCQTIAETMNQDYTTGILIEGTLIKPNVRSEFIHRINELSGDAFTRLYWMNTPVEECISRLEKRNLAHQDRLTMEDKIRRTIDPTREEPFDEIFYVESLTLSSYEIRRIK